MKLQRVYVDTSALGGCFDPEFAEWSNGLMQDFRIGLFKPLLSQVTATELQDAPEKVQAVYAEMLMLGAEIIEATESALELADAYQAHGILTPKFYDDGLHIAVATVGELELQAYCTFRQDTHVQCGESGVRLQAIADLQPAGGDVLWPSKELMQLR
jgi:hypothetical protein